MTLTLETLQGLLFTHVEGGILTPGNHRPPNGKCKACVRELRSLALGMGWTATPDHKGSNGIDRCCQIFNDAYWSSDVARTEACLPLALLSSKTAVKGWETQYILRTLEELGPSASSITSLSAVYVALRATSAACSRGAPSRDESLRKSVQILIECCNGKKTS